VKRTPKPEIPDDEVQLDAPEPLVLTLDGPQVAFDRGRYMSLLALSGQYTFVVRGKGDGLRGVVREQSILMSIPGRHVKAVAYKHGLAGPGKEAAYGAGAVTVISGDRCGGKVQLAVYCAAGEGFLYGYDGHDWIGADGRRNSKVEITIG